MPQTATQIPAHAYAHVSRMLVAGCKLEPPPVALASWHGQGSAAAQLVQEMAQLLGRDAM